MMADVHHNPSAGLPAAIPDDPRVFEVVDDYLRDFEAGRLANRESYLNRYPELANAVAQCLEGLDLVHAGRTGHNDEQTEKMPSRTPPIAADGFANPLGDFQIVREVARGGMGIVYEAVQLSLGRRVALKVLPFAATFDARQLQRFKNEAQAAALLHHTHIVPIYAVGCERGVHYYAMQFIEGQSLAAAIAELREKSGKYAVRETPSSNSSRVALVIGPAPAADKNRSTIDISAALTSGASISSEAYIRRVARLLVQAAEALEHAHQEGVVHRDIKPANLLVDAAGKLWITDFGLAQLQNGHNLTRTGDLLGTFRYMSPEQTGGSRTLLDHRTDIYSLGATFYELLTLEPAVRGETHQDLLFNILHSEPRPPREVNRAIPAELETILLKALGKTPGERYKNAAEFAADVQRYLEDRPILARRPTLVERARKWSRRHPSFVVAGVLMLAVIAVASLISAWFISNEGQKTAAALKREKLRATEAEQRFSQARGAVDALFEISEEELADKPFDGARRRILQVVLSHYQDFIEQRKGDPASQAELAQVQDKVKGILHELNVLRREMDLRHLGNPAVQDDLKLSEAQRETLNSLATAWFKENETLFAEQPSQSEEERRAKMVATAERRERDITALLSVEQLARLRQIGVQTQGLFAFREPEIVAALKLTSSQRAEIRLLEREMFAARFRAEGHEGPRGQGGLGRPGPRGPGGPRPGPGPERPPFGDFDRHRLDHDAFMAKALALLDEDQTATWKELTGEPFEGSHVPPFRGPGFGPPPPKS